MTSLYKNKGFLEVLEQIRVLYADRDKHLYTGITFRDLNSEKHIQIIPFRILYIII